MNKLNKSITLTLTMLVLSQATFAGMLDSREEEIISTTFLSSFTGGMVVAGTFGAGASGLALANSAMVLGLTLMSNNLSSTTDSEQNLKIVKEVINREAAVYQSSGEIGLVLGAAVNTLKSENAELSDAEAVDSLLAAIN